MGVFKLILIWQAWIWYVAIGGECPYHVFRVKVSNSHNDARLRMQTLVITESGLHIYGSPV